MEDSLLATGYAPKDAPGSFDLPEPSWLLVTPMGHVIVLGEMKEGLWGAYRAVSGQWTRMAMGQTGGSLPCHAVLFGDFLLVAHYGDGSVTALRLEDDGLPGKAVTAIAPSPGAHAHGLVPLDSAHLLLIDLGREVLELYQSNSPSEVSLELKATLSLASFSGEGETRAIGPRHLAVHPKLPLAYVVTEYSNELLVVEMGLSPPRLKEKFRVSLLPAFWAEPSFAGTVKVSPEGNFLLATNRGHDSVVSFTLEEGVPTLPVWTSSGGKWPRDAALSGSGDSLAVANQKSDKVTVFGRDPKTGILTPRADYRVAGASCVVFGNEGAPTLDSFDNTL